jgi:hypothetical protein
MNLPPICQLSSSSNLPLAVSQLVHTFETRKARSCLSAHLPFFSTGAKPPRSCRNTPVSGGPHNCPLPSRQARFVSFPRACLVAFARRHGKRVRVYLHPFTVHAVSRGMPPPPPSQTTLSLVLNPLRSWSTYNANDVFLPAGPS